MDLDLLSKVAQMGIGVMIAIIVLMWKRADDVKFQNDLRGVIASCNEREDKLIAVLETNTAAMMALKTAVEGFSSMRALEESVRKLQNTVENGRPRNAT
jgi:hypothetical protein